MSFPISFCIAICHLRTSWLARLQFKCLSLLDCAIKRGALTHVKDPRGRKGQLNMTNMGPTVWNQPNLNYIYYIGNRTFVTDLTTYGRCVQKHCLLRGLRGERCKDANIRSNFHFCHNREVWNNFLYYKSLPKIIIYAGEATYQQDLNSCL